LDGIATGTFRSATPAKQVCAEWLRQPSPEGHASLGDSTAGGQSRTALLIAERRIASTSHGKVARRLLSFLGALQATCHGNGRAMSVTPAGASRC